MNKKLLLFCNILFFSLHTFAMNIVSHRKQHLRGRIRHDVIEVIKRPILFCAAADKQESKQYSFLPKEINDKIFNYMTFNTCAESLDDFAQNIRNLGGVNKYLCNLINSSEFTLDLIKTVAGPEKFNCTHKKVAKTLPTEGAKNRFLLQWSLMNGWSNRFEKQGYDILKSKGVDLNFRWYKRYPHPLLHLASYGGDKNWRDVAFWFIENQADINAVDSLTGETVLMKALSCNYTSLVDILSKHPNLNVDDSKGLLLNCMLASSDSRNYPYYDQFFNEDKFKKIVCIVERLVAKGMYIPRNEIESVEEAFRSYVQAGLQESNNINKVE